MGISLLFHYSLIFFFFFFNDTATTEIYTLSLHDALPIFGVTSQRDTEWLTKHLVPQPLRTFEQPLPAAGGDKLKRTYIYCSKPATGTFDQFAERLRDDRKWTFHDLKTGHDAMVTAPGDIAKI